MKKTSPENIEIGKRLKKLRFEARLTIEEVALQIEIAPSTYREWENGRAITGAPYIKLAKALNTSVYKILGIEDNSKDQIYESLLIIENRLSTIRSLL